MVSTIEEIVPQDRLHLRMHGLFQEWLKSKKDSLFFSAEIKDIKDKKKLLIVTQKYVVQASEKKLFLQNSKVINGKIYRLDELRGITTSLMKNSTNFVLDFEDQPSCVLSSELRYEIIKTLI